MDPLYAMVCPDCGVVTPAAHDCDPLLVEFHKLMERWHWGVQPAGTFWRAQAA